MSLLFSSELGYVEYVQGEVKIKQSDENRFSGPILAGRKIYNRDKIITGEEGKFTFTLLGENVKVNLYNNSKVTINKENSHINIFLHYGNIWVNNKGLDEKCFIKTEDSFIYNEKGKVYIKRNYIDKDLIYSINRQIQIENKDEIIILEIGKMCLSNNEGILDIKDIIKADLPSDLLQELEINIIDLNRGTPFTLFTTITYDPEYIEVDTSSREKRFYFPVNIGSIEIEGFSYMNVYFSPIFKGKYLQLGYDFQYFINQVDSANDLNNFSVLQRSLAPLFFVVKSKWEGFSLKIGRINNLTFGYGNLIKRYTNSISTPIKQDSGLELSIKSGARNYTFDFFHSSITNSDNGIIGIYAKGRFFRNLPLTMGIGYVSDLNQFAYLSDTSWLGLEPQRSTVNGIQMDFTYPLKNTFRRETYLFLALTSLNFSDKLRFIRYEKVGNRTIDQGYQRKSAFGILGPGIWMKLGHHRDIKIAFNYASSLFASPFFGETYELERFHYVPRVELDSILNQEAYGKDSLWFNMIAENVSNIDSSNYYLPKQINNLLNPSENVNNKFGISLEYEYSFREYYNYGFNINMYKEFGSASALNTFYTAGIFINLNQGVINRINNFKIYYNQYFSKELFGIDNYKENIVLGIHISIKLAKSIFLYLNRDDIFYDNNLDGITDLNSKQGINLVLKF